ncbi:hypothetical protein [Sphingomonas aracearum]|uniref:Uncharacterized protein n=1 Tax=Sphingomonas aracearum TaxID=2283317 RepID=A0A369VXB6_9SPHN|nr:hypothetical protein [Sphingomonas aracearum]RDE06968.1 hypothetical protein DVW87_04690 [Sphingomonas aracearum]
MKTTAQEPGQTSQRVKVGMIGLAAVLLLIGLAAAIFSSVSKDRPLAGAHADAIANMAIANTSVPGDLPTSEPLAELGVAPATSGNSSMARR